MEILFPSLRKGKNWKIFLALQVPSDSQTVFRTNPTYLPTSRFAQSPFPNHWSVQIFFTSEIPLNVLIKVLEDNIIILIGQPGYCLIFILSNKGFYHLFGWISLSKTSVCLEGYNLLHMRKRLINSILFYP